MMMVGCETFSYFQIPFMFSIYYKDAFFTPYLGHGEAVRVLDAELGTLEMEQFRDTKASTRRRGVSRRESSSHGNKSYLTN